MRITTLLLLALATTACGDTPEPNPAEGAPGMRGEAVPDPAGDPARDAEPERGEETVRVWFSRDEVPVAVDRRVPDRGPEAALSALVEGPTAAERAAGLTSWFSDSTAGALEGVEQEGGFLVVDFRGLDQLIPGAGSSAGSAQLLASLDSTVFQFPSVDSVEYRLDGSCDAFWSWLQRECERVGRP
ncbi:MAG: GerMN domain-containing protein [Gemmatimonadetes bacterium]|nr:GerMN domain-containing protein [Gemmatimonadota bacterium]